MHDCIYHPIINVIYSGTQGSNKCHFLRKRQCNTFSALPNSGQTSSKGKKISHVRPTYVTEGEDLPYTFSFDAELRGKALSKMTTGNKTDKIKITENKKDVLTKVGSP